MKHNYEERTIPTQVELNAQGTLVGYAAIFESRSEDLGGWYERVGKGAFTKTLKDGRDVIACVGHDANQWLGRTSSGTLKLSTDDVGLHYEVTLPNTQTGREVRELIERGDIRGSSFLFAPIKQRYQYEEDGECRSLVRTLDEVLLADVGPTWNPAYLSTEAEMRSLRGIASYANLELDALLAARSNGDLGSLLVPEVVGAEVQQPPVQVPQSKPAEEPIIRHRRVR